MAGSGKDIARTPIIEQTTAQTFPGLVTGNKSPYPRVVIVELDHHIASGIEVGPHPGECSNM